MPGWDWYAKSGPVHGYSWTSKQWNQANVIFLPTNSWKSNLLEGVSQANKVDKWPTSVLWWWWHSLEAEAWTPHWKLWISWSLTAAEGERVEDGRSYSLKNKSKHLDSEGDLAFHHWNCAKICYNLRFFFRGDHLMLYLELQQLHEVKPRNTHILIPVLSAPLLCGSPPGTYESKRNSSILLRWAEHQTE